MKFIGSFINTMMACCANLATIQNACADSRGTAKDIIAAYVVCEDDLATIPAAVAGAITTAITMQTSKVWVQWDIDSVGSSYKVVTQGDGQAQEFLITVVLRIAGVSAAVSNSLNELIKGNANMLIKDKNGNKLLIGALGDGATIGVEQQNDPAGYIVTAKYSSDHLPYFYTSTITLV